MKVRSNVQLWRDEHGAAHVEAATEPDLDWGQGFVHATDRRRPVRPQEGRFDFVTATCPCRYRASRTSPSAGR